MVNSILVVCTGNICRSPMAEGLLRYRIAKVVPELKVDSAGLIKDVGYPADPLAQEVMLEQAGIDISNHRSKQINKELLLRADLILVMENRQQKQVEWYLPSVCGRVHRLGKWIETDIVDPYGSPKYRFEQTFVLLSQALEAWQKRL